MQAEIYNILIQVAIAHSSGYYSAFAHYVIICTPRDLVAPSVLMSEPLRKERPLKICECYGCNYYVMHAFVVNCLIKTHALDKIRSD